MSDMGGGRKGSLEFVSDLRDLEEVNAITRSSHSTWRSSVASLFEAAVPGWRFKGTVWCFLFLVVDAMGRISG